MSLDYYTAEKWTQLWPLDWYEGMFQESDWMKGEIMQPINPTYDNYFPYGCDVCKRGPSLTHTPLFYCSRCRIVKYCSREVRTFKEVVIQMMHSLTWSLWQSMPSIINPKMYD